MMQQGRTSPDSENQRSSAASPPPTASPPDYEPPNIHEARRFRSTTLPRRLRDPSQPSGFRLAAVGENRDQFGNEAQLYPVFGAGSNILNEFGVGVSLYFKTLKALFVLLFVCAFISLVREL